MTYLERHSAVGENLGQFQWATQIRFEAVSQSFNAICKLFIPSGFSFSCRHTLAFEAFFAPNSDLVSFSCRHTLAFEAFFAPNSDLEFTVTPTSGELAPAGSDGTLIRVAYKPQIYGKTHKAKLVVQVRVLFSDPRRSTSLRLRPEEVCCSVVSWLSFWSAFATFILAFLSLGQS